MQTKKKKKKILFVITKSNWGGAQKSVYDLATHMPRERYDIAVACGGDGILKTKLATTSIRTITIPFLERDITFITDGIAFLLLIRLLWKERPDIVHLHSSKIGAMGAVAARIYNLTAKSYKLKAKIIFTAHGWAFREERLLPVKLFILFFQWLAVVASHKTIAVSRITKQEVPKFFPLKKIIHIQNGILPPHFLSRNEARAYLKEKTDAPSNTFWIGTIGELTKNKGYHYAIAAIGELVRRTNRNISYIIIGGGEEKENLLKFIRTQGLADVIYIYEDMNAARLLPSYDCFLLPSIKEGLPYVLLEAGFAKVPVVATNIGGIPDIIREKQNGILVPPRDKHAIAEALYAILEDAPTRIRYGEELFASVQKNFSFETMLQKTIALYNSIT